MKCTENKIKYLKRDRKKEREEEGYLTIGSRINNNYKNNEQGKINKLKPKKKEREKKESLKIQPFFPTFIYKFPLDFHFFSFLFFFIFFILFSLDSLFFF